MDISIVIPMYNEAHILEDSISKITAIMDITKFSYELILIDDSSQDDTVAIARRIIKQHFNAKFFVHEKNKGRGATVAEGIKIAKGKIAGFIDIDLSTHPIYIPLLAYKINNGIDVATAHRIYKLNYRCFFRWLISKGYNVLFKLSTGIPLRDTETGCKFFNREKILPVLSQIEDKYWFWDTEVMVFAYLRNFNIEEVPTVFVRREELGSRVRIIRDSFRHFFSLMKLRKKIREGKRCSFYPALKSFTRGYFERIYLFLKCKVIPVCLMGKIMPMEGKILDIGCGKGIFSGYLAASSSVRNVIGVDLCSAKIKAAQESFSSLPNLVFIEKDATEILSKETDLSGVVISDFLHHVDFTKQEELLRLAYGGLSNRGTMLIKEIDKNASFRYFSSKLSDSILYFRDKIYYRSLKEWTTLLKNIGFQVESRPANTVFGSTVLYICKKA